jgi:hypothetical protein
MSISWHPDYSTMIAVYLILSPWNTVQVGSSRPSGLEKKAWELSMLGLNRMLWQGNHRPKAKIHSGCGEKRRKKHRTTIGKLGFHEIFLIAKLVNIPSMSLWFMIPIIIVFMGVTNQHSHHIWGPHIVGTLPWRLPGFSSSISWPVCSILGGVFMWKVDCQTKTWTTRDNKSRPGSVGFWKW